MEISVNGLIILTTRPEKHVYFTYFFIPLLLFQSFVVKCGEKNPFVLQTMESNSYFI